MDFSIAFPAQQRGRDQDFSSAFPAQQRGRYKDFSSAFPARALQGISSAFKGLSITQSQGNMLSTCN